MSASRTGVKIAARPSDRVRAYLAALPPASRKRLKEMLEGRPFVYYAAFTHHTSLFPMTDDIRRLVKSRVADVKAKSARR